MFNSANRIYVVVFFAAGSDKATADFTKILDSIRTG